MYQARENYFFFLGKLPHKRMCPFWTRFVYHHSKFLPIMVAAKTHNWYFLGTFFLYQPVKLMFPCRPFFYRREGPQKYKKKKKYLFFFEKYNQFTPINTHNNVVVCTRQEKTIFFFLRKLPHKRMCPVWTRFVVPSFKIPSHNGCSENSIFFFGTYFLYHSVKLMLPCRPFFYRREGPPKYQKTKICFFFEKYNQFMPINTHTNLVCTR